MSPHICDGFLAIINLFEGKAEKEKKKKRDRKKRNTEQNSRNQSSCIPLGVALHSYLFPPFSNAKERE